MKNELKKVKFVQLRSSGKTYNEISDELKISKPTLIKWSKDLESDLHNEMETQKETLLQNHNLNQERIFQLKSKIIDKLEDEILNGDLSDVPKNKLLDTLIKLLEGIPQKPSFKSFELPRLLDEMKWKG